MGQTGYPLHPLPPTSIQILSAYSYCPPNPARPGCCPSTWLIQGHLQEMSFLTCIRPYAASKLSLPSDFPFYFITNASHNSSSSLTCQVWLMPASRGSLICHLLSTPKEQTPWLLWMMTAASSAFAATLVCPKLDMALAGIQSPEQAGPRVLF